MPSAEGQTLTWACSSPEFHGGSWEKGEEMQAAGSLGRNAYLWVVYPRAHCWCWQEEGWSSLSL